MANEGARGAAGGVSTSGMMAVGSSSAVLVSKGPAPARGAGAVVPDVVGKKQAEALEALQAAGFEVQALRNHNESFKAGVVSHQLPAAGVEVTPGMRVCVFSSAGPVTEGTMLVTLPDLVGKGVDEAQGLMTAADLKLTVLEDYSATVPAGVAFAQEPNPRTVDRKPPKKSLAWLWVVLAVLALAVAAYFLFFQKPAEVLVPSVIGLSEANAEAKLVEVGLVLGKVGTEPTSAAEPGVVISQDPVLGTMAAEGDRVDIVVAEALAGVEVPDVVGDTLADATVAIGQAGLNVRTEEVYSADVEVGKVVAQSPKAGTRVEPGAEVALSVSKGEEPVANATVPNLKGMTQAAAESALKAEGLTGRALLGYSDVVPSGQVIAQAPVAGSSVAPGTQVLFQVSQGAPPATATLVEVPDLKGMTADQAEDAVKALGLDDEVVEIEYAEAAAGTVIGQLPAAGDMVPEGSTVSIAVAKAPLQ